MTDWYVRDFTAWNNANWVESFVLGDPDDDTWNLTGATIAMDMRPVPGHPDAELSLSIGSGITVDDAATRAVTISVSVDTMKERIPLLYYYDIVVTTAGVPRLRQTGKITIRTGVTAPA